MGGTPDTKGVSVFPTCRKCVSDYTVEAGSPQGQIFFNEKLYRRKCVHVCDAYLYL